MSEVGDKIGMLSILNEMKWKKNGKIVKMYKCKCECGNIKKSLRKIFKK